MQNVWIEYGGRRWIFKRLCRDEIQELVSEGFKVHFRKH